MRITREASRAPAGHMPCTLLGNSARRVSHSHLPQTRALRASEAQPRSLALWSLPAHLRKKGSLHLNIKACIALILVR